MRQRLLLASLFMVLAAGGASAADVTGRTLTLAGTLPLGQQATLAPAATAATVIAYSNIANFTGYTYVNGGATGVVYNAIYTRLSADDITPAPGFGGLDVRMCWFSVGNTSGEVVMFYPSVRFYLANGAGGGPGTLIRGFRFNPFYIAPGVSTIGFDPAGELLLPLTSFWAGMTFDSGSSTYAPTAAQLNALGQGVFGPPVVGSSADLAFLTNAAGSHNNNNPAGVLGNMGGTPIANFGWQFEVGAPVPAIPSTWGRVKSLYR